MQRGHQKRPSAIKKGRNCCRMNVSWSDWKVRQGRAYSVTLPPAFGHLQGNKIMSYPSGDLTNNHLLNIKLENKLTTEDVS